jgi:uncharacterized protein
MPTLNYTESTRKVEDAIWDEVIPAGKGWMHLLEAGQFFRILDLEGNQAVDTLFYNADSPGDRYSAVRTIRKQGNLFLTTGSKLMSEMGNELVEIVADTCGRHDTLGGACSAESNTVRYALDKKHMHNCRDSFLLTMAMAQNGYGKRDLTANVNFFMNVPVTREGKLTFADGVSSPGKYVEMEAKMRVMVLISNCPQLNNPCNAYNPTPVRVSVWNP